MIVCVFCYKKINQENNDKACNVLTRKMAMVNEIETLCSPSQIYHHNLPLLLPTHKFKMSRMNFDPILGRHFKNQTNLCHLWNERKWKHLLNKWFLISPSLQTFFLYIIDNWRPRSNDKMRNGYGLPPARFTEILENLS